MCDVLRRCAPRWTPAVGRGRASFYSPRAQVSWISWRLMSANCPLRLDSFQDNGRGITLSFFCTFLYVHYPSLSALLSLFSAVCLILSVLKIALGTSNLVLLTRTELTAQPLCYDASVLSHKMDLTKHLWSHRHIWVIQNHNGEVTKQYAWEKKRPNLHQIVPFLSFTVGLQRYILHSI